MALTIKKSMYVVQYEMRPTIFHQSRDAAIILLVVIRDEGSNKHHEYHYIILTLQTSPNERHSALFPRVHSTCISDSGHFKACVHMYSHF